MQSVTLPIGTELGGYVLAGVLGSGASGTVYRARDADGMPVALKLLHPTSATDAGSRQRLRREVRAQRAIHSPFVAQVVDAELDGAEAFIVTELVEGISLARDISANGPWQFGQLAELARDLDEALDEVHAARVLHRDIKPSNVVLNKRGRPVLIDFGIAQDSGAGRLTAAGLVAGTPGFVSPDLLRGAEPSIESDRWAAAALLLNAATGRQPFGTGTVEAVLSRVLEGLPDVEGLPSHVATAFHQALTPDVDRRLHLPDLADAIGPQDGIPTELAAPPVEAPTAQLPPPPREAPAEDPLTAWTRPVHLPWSEPRRVDYRTWLSDTQRLPETAPAAQVIPPHAADAAAPPQPYPSPPGPLRLMTLMLWVLLGAAALWWPVAVLASAVCLLVVARTVWVAAVAVAARRYRRGPRASDRTRTALGVPWYFLRGLGGAIPSLGLAVLVGGAGYLVAVQVAGAARQPAAALCLAIGLMVAWWGPSGGETRNGARAVLRGLFWEPWVRWLGTLLIALAAAALAGAWFG
ncbi:MAG: serine/threonine protein kinase [Bifidobacteriaceae bacterium]|jgi:serine/threonine protein kinase|nr:serine/threonine protein kinase [Bifidobacteriaceae bacterium]